MAYKYTNFVEGILDADGGGINDSTTSIAVDFATNSVVPTGLSGSNYMMFVIDPEGAEHAPEVVKATGISGSSNPYTLTVTRNQESSGAKAFDQGRKIVGAVTAAQLTNFATKDATVFTGDVTIPDGDLILGSTAVSSTAAELNILDGCTATVSELNIMDGVTANTSELNIMDGVTATTAEINYLDNDDLVAADITKLAAITADANEINVLDGVTGGTVTASKAVVVDANKDIASFRNVTLTGELDAATLDISGVVDIDGDVDITANLAFTGTLSGTSSIPRMAYTHTSSTKATVASHQLNSNPSILICDTQPTASLNDGDIWFDIS